MSKRAEEQAIRAVMATDRKTPSARVYEITNLPEADKARVLEALRARGLLPPPPEPRPKKLLCGHSPEHAKQLDGDPEDPESGVWVCTSCGEDHMLVVVGKQH